MFATWIRLFCFSFMLAWSFAPHAKSDKPLKPSSFSLPNDPAQFQFVRILLLKNVRQVTLESPGGFEVLDKDRRTLFTGPKLPSTLLSSNGSVLMFGKQKLRDIPIMVHSNSGSIKIQGKEYRDDVQVWIEPDGTLTLVNYIDVESYLKGVLSWEANPKWGIEALKAQAITSRTYALFKSLENQQLRYDMSKDVLSQVYAGKNAERSATNHAVEATRGQILVYRGKIFPAYFHSTCGGGTTDAHTVWDYEPHPVLKGTLCNFCRSSKHYSWHAEFTRGSMESALRKGGLRINNLKKVWVADRDALGRAVMFGFEGDEGKIKVRANDFRLWMDPAKFKSTMILDIQKSEAGYFFKGRGWGHGAGLCQYGMKTLAEMGYTDYQILKYYYPDTDIIDYFHPSDL